MPIFTTKNKPLLYFSLRDLILPHNINQLLMKKKHICKSVQHSVFETRNNAKHSFPKQKKTKAVWAYSCVPFKSTLYKGSVNILKLLKLIVCTLAWGKSSVGSSTAPEATPVPSEVGSIALPPAVPSYSCWAPPAAPLSPPTPLSLGFGGWRLGTKPLNVFCAAREVGHQEVGGVCFCIQVTICQCRANS